MWDLEKKSCATEKKQWRFRHQPSFDFGAGTGCGLAHDLFSDPLVVRNDHRGLHFKHAADPDCFFSDAAVAVFGLALGDHHVTVGLTLPAVAVIVWRTQGLRFFTSRRLLYAALISIGALVAAYAYLPIAAARSPVINWGNPRSLQEIWWHITGRQYRVFFSFSPNIMGGQFIEFCRLLLREFGFVWLPLLLVLAFAGFATAYRRDRTGFWFLLFIVIADLAYALTYEIAEDKDAYYLPTFIAIAIAAGFGIRWLIQLTLSKSILVERSY